MFRTVVKSTGLLKIQFDRRAQIPSKMTEPVNHVTDVVTTTKHVVVGKDKRNTYRLTFNLLLQSEA